MLKLIRKKHYSTEFFLCFGMILFWIISFLLLRIITNTEIGYALIFLVSYLWGMTLIWELSAKRLNLVFLFYLTFGLFIGGRFFAVLLGYSNSIWSPTFFYNYQVDIGRKIEIMHYVLGFINSYILGYYFCRHYTLLVKEPQLSCDTLLKINTILKWIFIPVAIYVIFQSIQTFVRATQIGYISLYLDQNQHGGHSNILISLLPVLLGLAVAYGDRRNRFFYLMLFVFQSLISLFIGARGSFGSVILVLLWLYSQYHHISLKKLAVCLCCMIGVLIALASLSIRGLEGNFSEFNIWDLGLSFIYDQGVTLMVFDASRLIDNYPILPYFQSFLPGFVRMFEFFSGTQAGTDATFAAHMCSTLNHQMYYEGYGLGWSLLCDFYLFSGRIFIIFILISIVWGYSLGTLIHGAEQSRLLKMICFAIIFQLLRLSRSGLNSVIPMIYYSLLIWGIIILSIQIYRKYLILRIR